MRPGAPTGDAGCRRPALAGFGSLIAWGWQAYWDWRIRRTTVLMLRSLDRRMLRDIGIDPSEIESLAYDVRGDRRRRHDGTRNLR
jgi:uncharacterized protein YjiS (DUF1127 family)